MHLMELIWNMTSTLSHTAVCFGMTQKFNKMAQWWWSAIGNWLKNRFLSINDLSCCSAISKIQGKIVTDAHSPRVLTCKIINHIAKSCRWLKAWFAFLLHPNSTSDHINGICNDESNNTSICESGSCSVIWYLNAFPRYMLDLKQSDFKKPRSLILPGKYAVHSCRLAPMSLQGPAPISGISQLKRGYFHMLVLFFSFGSNLSLHALFSLLATFLFIWACNERHSSWESPSFIVHTWLTSSMFLLKPRPATFTDSLSRSWPTCWEKRIAGSHFILWCSSRLWIQSSIYYSCKLSTLRYTLEGFSWPFVGTKHAWTRVEPKRESYSAS